MNCLPAARLILALTCAISAACSSVPPFENRRALAERLAGDRGWQATVLPGREFDLVSFFSANHSPQDLLTIYIEGDGLAWISRDEPSPDPTPANPLALRLALAQPVGNVAYLSRPCQFVDALQIGCPRMYWKNRRFSVEVIDAMDRAVDALKQQFAAKRVILVGYSGGGAIAALVATRRDDVALLATVAGNLDIDAWSSMHRVSRLDGSLNPADAAERLTKIRQLHFAGDKDRNVPPELVQKYAMRFPAAERPEVRVEPGFDHQCCWVEEWPRLWRQMVGFTK